MALPLPVLSWVNHVDGATIAASAEVATMPASNLAETIVGRRWRTETLTANVDFDFGSNKTVGVLALRFPREVALPDGSITHELDADGGSVGTGAAYSDTGSLGVVDGYGYHVHVLAAAVTARYWRFTFSSITGVTFIDVGRAWAGAAWLPTYGISFGAGDEWEDLSRITESLRSGAEFVDNRPSRRLMPFGLDALSDDEADDIRELQRIAGMSGQILAVRDTGNPGTSAILGRLSRSTPILHAEISLHSKAFEIRESL